MEPVLSNVPDCKLYTWIKVVSTTHLLSILEQLFYGTFQDSGQLLQLFSQISFIMLVQDTTPFLQYLLFTFAYVLTVSCNFLYSETLTFELHLIFDIPEAYLHYIRKNLQLRYLIGFFMGLYVLNIQIIIFIIFI